MFEHVDARVLLVEDHGVNRKLAGAFIQKLGLEVDMAIGGGEALEKIARNAYDLVFMDVQMPGMDGLETTRRLRDGVGGSAGRFVPVVALTARDRGVDREMATAAGMNDFLVKPVSPRELAGILARHLLPRLEVAGTTRDPAPKPGSPEPILNVEELRARLLGDESAMWEMLRKFRDEIRADTRWLRELDPEGSMDRERFFQRMHRLKGASANMGARRVVRCVSEMERSTGDDLDWATRRLLTTLESLLDEFATLDLDTHDENTDCG